MKPEIKKLWVEALRSGEYTQGEGCLKRNDEFCCLGVLCDLYLKQGNEAQWTFDEGKHLDQFVIGAFKASAVLPSTVQNWAGLEGSCGWVDGAGYANLASLNDSGHNFDEIANIIEANL